MIIKNSEVGLMRLKLGFMCNSHIIMCNICKIYTYIYMYIGYLANEREIESLRTEEGSGEQPRASRERERDHE